jgi:CHAT domain-containing protein
MGTKLIVRGTKESPAGTGPGTRGKAPAPPARAATDLLTGVKELAAFSLSPSARAKGKAKPESLDDVLDDDVLEITLEGGVTLWTSLARYREQLADLKPDSVRKGEVTVEVLPRPSATERGGIKEWAQAGLRVLRLEKDRVAEDLKDPSKWREWAQDTGLDKAGQLGAWAGTKLLTWLIEKRLEPGPGLYPWNDSPAGAAGALAPQAVERKAVPADAPILVFIHGTASSTLGSFGALADAASAPQWGTLRRQFGERIYAFEHRTLSQSPIENAIELAALLPEGARVSLVSHSRGGLVGDLLCLDGIDQDQIGRFRRFDPDLEQADEYDRDRLRRLDGLLRERKLDIGRFTRVACPARGTLLASENIDEFLSVLTSLIGLIPGFMGSPVYEIIKRVTLEVVRNRKKPELIPGIEAMMPTAPLVDLLNSAPRSAKGGLGVIAGDIEGGSWFRRIGTFLTDTFIYESRDNDLVVNTDSMFQGAPRDRATRPGYVFDQGADVSHFNYFRNERTRIALLNWLGHDPKAPPPEFRELEPAAAAAPVPMLEPRQTRSGADQPVLFLLPDIMGSLLEADGSPVWPVYARLREGRLADLAGKRRARPTHLLGDTYGALADYLAGSHKVIPFAYDWRGSGADAAQELAKQVRDALTQPERAVRFVAHGAGGLVVHHLMADGKLWEEIFSRPGSRAVLLGPPCGGTYGAVQALLGVAPVVRQIDLLDREHSLQEIVDLVGGFRGVLELLPRDGSLDYFDPETWKRLRRANGVSALPGAGELGAARRTLDALSRLIPQAGQVAAIAGCAPATVCRLEPTGPGGRPVFHATTEGDGQVTWPAGVIPGAGTWYARAEHGELPSTPSLFPAILDLLERGATARLPDAPPGASRGSDAEFRYFPEPVLYPTEGDLGAGVTGRRTRAYRPVAETRLQVEVVHGDLREARYALMVGHYQGDTIAGSERVLDERLGEALTDRYQLGRYPGLLGTVEVVLRPPNQLQAELGVPRGGIVIGLGSWGELSPEALANAVRDGAAQYSLERGDRRTDAISPGDPGLPPGTVGLSTLLIGYNSNANMAVEDSMNALLRAIIQANHELGKRRGRCPLIGRLEIIELFSDTAIEAARAAKRLAPALARDLGVDIEVSPRLDRRASGRVRLTQASGSGYWRRWGISTEKPPEAPPPPGLPVPLARRLKRVLEQDLEDPAGMDRQSWQAVMQAAFPAAPPPPGRALRFLALSDRARAEVVFQQPQPEAIDELIRKSIRSPVFRPEEASTLFDLLIPHDLKDSLAQQSQVVLVVDAGTADYPWELMVDGREPLCIRIGLVRQLQTARFRRQVRGATAAEAFVAGDPLTPDGYAPLPGARDEATLVAQRLGRRFAVTHSEERLSAPELISGLLARPYRVVHLAGHGDYRASGPGGESRTGMVLEGGVFLTAAEISNMRQVPDLVFLNCCHLGRVGEDGQEAREPVAYNKLAASLSRELIDIGVRAVVAAGWAVRDDAAHSFAKCFYDAMLAGEPFGRALKLARQETWRAYPDCNTWGAYQAYGDPDFRLFRGEAEETQNPDFVAPEEVLVELDAVLRWFKDAPAADRSTGAGAGGALERISRLFADTPSEWRGRAEVLAAFGHACMEMKALDSAIKYFRLALEVEDVNSPLPLRIVERLANAETRHGEETGDAGLIETAIARIESLLGIAETGERLSLMGSAEKSLARLQDDPGAVLKHLEQAADCYRRAAERKERSGGFEVYPVFNWLALACVLGRRVADAEGWIKRCLDHAKSSFASSRSFWDAVAFPDFEVIRRMAAGTLPGTVDEIIARYRQALEETRAQPREMDSVIRQLRLMESTLQKLGPGEGGRPGPEVAAALNRIRTGLGSGDETAHPAAEVAPDPGPGRARRAKAAPPAGRSGRRKASRRK